MIPGVSFAIPGPAGGGGSLTSRQTGFARCLRTGRLSRFALDARTMFGHPFCHRYYDPLRLPNVRREILRHPARPSLPVASAFSCTQGIGLAERQVFPARSFGHAVDSHGVQPVLIRAFKTGNDEALSSSRAIPMSTWPALRPRWSLVRLAHHARRHAAFRLVETVRVPRDRSGTCHRLSSWTTTFKQLSRLNHTPCRLARPRSRPLFPRAARLCYWAGGYGVQVPCARLEVSRRVIYQMSTPKGKALGEGNCGSGDRPWGGSLRMCRQVDKRPFVVDRILTKPARLRTETAYKADSLGEWAKHHEAVPNRGYGKCGACAGKVHVLIRGGLESRSGSRLYDESRSRVVRASRRFQQSAEAIVRVATLHWRRGRAEP